MDYFYLGLRILATLIGIVTIYYGFYLITRTEGKLEKAIIFVCGSVLIFTIVNVLGIIESFYSVNLNTLRAVANPIGILLILFAACSIKKLVEESDDKQKNKTKKTSR